MSPRRARGAALLVALLSVALIASLASAALWRLWQHVEIEQAERDRQQAQWILTGALDWARLILREDARTNQNTGSGDHLAEPWAVGLEEARLSSFLNADAASEPPAALQAFLSGQISDQQGLLNIANLGRDGALSSEGVQAFERLFDALGLPRASVRPAALAWVRSAPQPPAAPPPGSASPSSASAGGLPPAAAARAAAESGAAAPLRPQRVSQLGWLGWSPQIVQRIAPYVSVLPEPTPVNLNTAPAPVLMAAIAGLDRAQAQRILSHRALQPFRTLPDLNAVLPGLRLDSQWHSTQSRYFLVRGTLRLDALTVVEESLLVRNGLDVRTLWRERVPTSPPTAADDPAARP